MEGGGTITVPQHIRDTGVSDFLINRAREVSELNASGINDRERERISQHALKNAKKYIESDQGMAMSADYGSAVVPRLPLHGKVQRNERCPCGSGNKYKRCHGSSQ